MTTFALPQAGDWDDDSAGHRSRPMLWASWCDGLVTLDGVERADGAIEASVSIWLGDAVQLDATQARALALALPQAADALDAMAGHR